MEKKKEVSALDKYKSTNNYQVLIKNHSLDEEGFWRVRGEEDLGIYEGKLIDILSYAVTLHRFWCWGASGYITKVIIPKIDSETSARRIKAEQKVKDIEEQLKQAQMELKSYGV